MNGARVYLDWNATAPMRPEARAAIAAAQDLVGNPSSVHAEGRAAKAAVERARGQVARAFGAEGADIVFTSGATEAAALALSGAEVAASAVEHDCVAAWAAAHLPVDAHGQVDRAALRAFAEPDARGDGRRVVAVQAANSETGIAQDIGAVAAALDGSTARPVLLVDAVQVAGKLPWRFDRCRADMALVSAHKFGGPKGVGALIATPGLDLPPVLRGGGQEMGRRSGTPNVAAITAMGAAAEAAARDVADGCWAEVEKLRSILEGALDRGQQGIIFVGKVGLRLPNTSCVIAPGWRGETQVMAMDLDGFAISAGSACSSGKVRENRVLRAMGHEDEWARCAIRVSLGPETTQDDVTRFADGWRARYAKICARAA